MSNPSDLTPVHKHELDLPGRRIWNAGFRSGYNTCSIHKRSYNSAGVWWAWVGLVVGFTAGIVITHALIGGII